MDVCCLNRPFDDQGQFRVRLEAEAVGLALVRAQSGMVHLVGSEAIEHEVSMNPYPGRRWRVAALAGAAESWVHVSDREHTRATELRLMGFGAYDALHLACAESGAADVFLTADDRLLRTATRHEAGL